MKKLNIFLVCVIPILIYSQNTFNKHFYFDGIAAVGNGILVTDTCYYISGIVVDTINQRPYEAFFLAKMDLSGEIESSFKLLDTFNSYENWVTPLLYNHGAFTSIGYGTDTLEYLYWLKIDTSDSIIDIKKYRSYFSPEDYFIRPLDAVFDSIYQKYYITTLIGRVEANGILNEDYSILVLDVNGNYLWEQVYGDSWGNFSESILFQNNHVILGSKRANFNLTRWDLKYYTKIIATDTLGEIQWTWQSPSSLQQGANDMVATEDGGLVIASGRGFLEQVNAETKRILWDRGLVFKLDSNRQVVWETEFSVPYPGRNELSSLVKAIDETGYIAAGKQTDLYGDEPGGAVMGWITKTSLAGDSLWSRKLFYYEYPDSLEYWHQIHDLQTTPDGGYLMSGQTLDQNLLSSPIQQAWFIKVDSEGCLIPGCGLVDATEPSEEEGPALLLYPNPASDYLNVYLGDSGSRNWSFVVYSNTGQQMGSYAATAAHTTYMIAVNRWPAGLYHLRVLDDKGRFLKSYPWVKS